MNWIDVVDEHGALRVKAEVKGTVGQRLKGLLGTGCETHPVVLVPCHAIHTMGMKYPIDVAFIDTKGEVVAAHRAVPPGRRLRHRGAALVAERPAKDDPWFETGKRVVYRAHKNRKVVKKHAPNSKHD